MLHFVEFGGCQEAMLEQLTADKSAAEKVHPQQNGRSEVETFECAENGT